jgi:hypothetical protein
MNRDCVDPITEIIRRILLLQRQDLENDNISCDRPFLGPLNILTYNTRPIQLYNKYTASPWEFTYTLNNETQTTNIFRVESLEQDCVTLRLLSYDQTTSEYSNTNQFVTLDLTTVGAIRCLPDTFITL